MDDVAVVGGGPGGLYLATQLAKSGFQVAVYEEHAVSGDPVHCTGVLAAEAFDEFDLPRQSILNDLGTARFIAPSGHSIAHTTATLEAVAVDRLVFDRLLFEQAASVGATLIPRTRVTSLDIGSREVRLGLSDGGHATSRLCVLACGASYRLQQRLGMGLPQVFMQSAQMEVPLSTSCDVEVHFGRSIAPGGFAWVVPVRRPSQWCARVGLMCERDAATYFQRFVERIQDRLGLHGMSELDSQPRRKMLPLAPISRTYTDRVLAIGDAAGIVKATTGGGIYYSVLSAAIAAAVLDDALRSDSLDAAALSRYQRMWRSKLGTEIDAQLELRELAHRMDDSDIEAFFELARTDGIMPIIRQTARFNQHRSLILALFRHPPARRALFDRLRNTGYRVHAADGTAER
jgi:geranylgeranyl reductase family protein